MSKHHPRLSLIVPCFNEEDSVRPLYEASIAALSALGLPFELILVDDGSTDATCANLAAIARLDPRVRIVRFRRNYGQTAAMAAGIAHARAEIVVTMDGDLQNDPADIGTFLAKLDQGFDIVVGWRANRQDKFWTRKVPSRIANWIIGKVTGVPIKDNGCSLKAFRAAVIKQIPLYSEMHRFIPAMASIAGPRIAEVETRHHARRFGQSKYGLSRIYKVLLDLMVIKTLATFASRPLRWFVLLGIPFALVGTAAIVHALWSWAMPGGSVPLPVAGTGMILLMSAVLLFSSGALAELIYNLGDVRDDDFSRLTARVRRPL